MTTSAEPPEHAPAPPERSVTVGAASVTPPVNGEAAQWRALVMRVYMFARILAGILLDLAFVVLWAILTHYFTLVLENFSPTQVLDRFILVVLQVLFAGSTLVVVASYVLRDVWTAVRRIWRKRD